MRFTVECLSCRRIEWLDSRDEAAERWNTVRDPVVSDQKMIADELRKALEHFIVETGPGDCVDDADNDDDHYCTDPFCIYCNLCRAFQDQIGHPTTAESDPLKRNLIDEAMNRNG